MAGVPATVTSTGKLIPFDPGALIAMAALNGPGPCRADGLTVTASVLGRGPDAGNTFSQFPPSPVTQVTVNEFMLELVLDTVTGSVAGRLLLAAKLKLSELGLAERGLGPPEELALNTTGTERNEPAEVMLRNPTSVPEVGAVVGSIDTDSVSGVGPLAGLTFSQLLLENEVTVMFACPLEEIISGCAELDGPLNVSCVGLAVSELLCARAVSIEHTRADSRTARRNKNFCVVFTIFSKQSRNCGKEEDAATGD